MKLQCTWNDKMSFTAVADVHEIHLDTQLPMGADTAMTPKQLVVAAICGCMAMDVVALLKKFKQPLESLLIDADTSLSEGSCQLVFKEVHLGF